MATEDIAGFAALAWLVGASVVMARSVQRGRALADDLAARHPEAYEALGRPRPGYFESARRSRFAQFMARREYESLEDPPLAARFEAHRKAETRLLGALLASLVAVFLGVLAASRFL